MTSGAVIDQTGLLSSSATVSAVAARHAVQADSNRRLSGEVVAALLGAGYARHFAPARHGGTEGSFAELIRALIAVAGGCTSAAWCGMIFATSGRMAGYLPERGQQEIWGEGPDVPIAAAFVPSGRVERDPAGWRLTGEWRFLSGVDFSEWALLCGSATVDGHEQRRFFAVPRREYEVKDSWFTVGMRGTGSNSVVLDDAVVPEHRSFAESALLSGRCEGSTARCHTVPLLAVAGPLFAAPAVGAVRGALRTWSESIAGNADNGRPAWRNPAAQEVLTRSATEVDVAELLLERAGAVADADAAVREHAARSARDAAIVAETAVSTMDRLFRAGGSRAQAERSPLQRLWRDVASATSHAALRLERNSEHFARHVWG